MERATCHVGGRGAFVTIPPQEPSSSPIGGRWGELGLNLFFAFTARAMFAGVKNFVPPSWWVVLGVPLLRSRTGRATTESIAGSAAGLKGYRLKRPNPGAPFRPHRGGVAL